MASSSQTNPQMIAREASQPIMAIQQPILVGTQFYVPESHLEEGTDVYRPQVIIPFNLANKTRAIMGPLPSSEPQATFFPAYHKTRPLISRNKVTDKGKLMYEELGEGGSEPSKGRTIAQEKISLDYLTNTLKVFRFIPLAKDPEPYYAWLNKVE